MYSGAKLLQMCISYQFGRQPAVNSRQSPSSPPLSLSLYLSLSLSSNPPQGQLARDLCAKSSLSLSRTIRQSLPRFGCYFCCCCKGSRSFDLPFVWPLALPLRAFSGLTVTASPTKITVTAQYRMISARTIPSDAGSSSHREAPPLGAVIIVGYSLRFISIDKTECNSNL